MGSEDNGGGNTARDSTTNLGNDPQSEFKIHRAVADKTSEREREGPKQPLLHVR